MRYVLTVPNIEPKIFEAYWYGYGTVITQTEGTVPARNGGPTYTYVLDYEGDKFRADYQAGRFASGLYFAEVTAVDTAQEIA